jgi:type III secretory pathway component EscR
MKELHPRGGKGKVKLFLYLPWSSLSLIFSDIRLIDGSKVVSPMRRPLLTSRKVSVKG